MAKKKRILIHVDKEQVTLTVDKPPKKKPPKKKPTKRIWKKIKKKVYS